MLTRDQIQAVADFDREQVSVPEWGGLVYMRSMTCRALEDMQIWFLKMGSSELRQQPEALRDMKTTLVSHCLCDEQGQLLFDDAEGRDILSQKSGVVIDRLADIALRLNKLTEEAQDLEKKASPMPVNGSASSSPGPSVAPSPNSTDA
jgi:hypothetical protein